jgi:hypothetical protein
VAKRSALDGAAGIMGGHLAADAFRRAWQVLAVNAPRSVQSHLSPLVWCINKSPRAAAYRAAHGDRPRRKPFHHRVTRGGEAPTWLLNLGEAAIDAQFGAGHEAAVIGRQEQGGGRDLFRAAHPIEWYRRGERRPDLGGGLR